MFIKLVSEPYPALILPGFGTPPKEGNLIECEITTAFLHYPKGDSIELSVPLMLDLPFPYARLKMNKIFAEGGEFFDDKKGKHWWRYFSRLYGRCLSCKIGFYRKKQVWDVSEVSLVSEKLEKKATVPLANKLKKHDEKPKPQ